MRVDLFDFNLPSELIALRPAKRGSARLLLVDPTGEPTVSDHLFSDLGAHLAPGDALVFNDTRVIPARLQARRYRGQKEAATGHPKIELTLHKAMGEEQWMAFARPQRKLEVGDRLVFFHPETGDGSTFLEAEILGKDAGGEVCLSFSLSNEALWQALGQLGVMPLPPYIASRRPPDSRDESDYQTLYAARSGAVAAPTAGLHFSAEFFDGLPSQGISCHFVTLHVGAGTFLPVKTDETSTHKMHAEWGEVSPQTASALNKVRKGEGRLIAVGTTSLRLLESAANEDGEILPFSGDTDIFITPGYAFKSANMLVTNFHLPRSTLFMLVSAFSGLSLMKSAYAHAIREGYRFYSYGDACLLKRHEPGD